MNLDYDLFRIFYAVCSNGTMSGAAKQLDMTTATVSRSIRQLENYLCYPLLTRSNRGVSLTANGESLYHQTDSALRIIELGVQNLLVEPKANPRQVQICTTSISASFFLTPCFLPVLRVKHPDLRIRLKTMPEADIEAALLDGQCDFAVSRPVSTLHHNIGLEPLFTNTNHIVVGKQYKSFAQKFKSTQELTDLPLITVPDDQLISIHYAEYFRQIGITRKPTIIVDDIYQQLSAVASGLGFSFFPISALITSPFNEQLIHLQIPGNQQPLASTDCLMYRNDVATSFVVKSCFDILRDVASSFQIEIDKLIK